MIALIELSFSPVRFSLSNVFIISSSFLGRSPVLWGRRLAWFRIPAWGVGDPGFKSQRPHHKTRDPTRKSYHLCFLNTLEVIRVVQWHSGDWEACPVLPYYSHSGKALHLSYRLGYF